MILTVIDIQGNKRTYECEHYKVTANEKSCFFCKHCTDIFFDYTNGPYMFICNKNIEPTHEILSKGCITFEE